MDRYKFRGKHVSLVDKFNSGEWVYGYLSAPNYINSEELGGEMLVDPKTVGQYTGLSDKNGKEAYADDVVRYEGSLYIVKWDHVDTGFYLADIHSLGDLDSENHLIGSCITDGEVIGSVHDNPELLE